MGAIFHTEVKVRPEEEIEHDEEVFLVNPTTEQKYRVLIKKQDNGDYEMRVIPLKIDSRIITGISKQHLDEMIELGLLKI